MCLVQSFSPYLPPAVFFETIPLTIRQLRLVRPKGIFGSKKTFSMPRVRTHGRRRSHYRRTVCESISYCTLDTTLGFTKSISYDRSQCNHGRSDRRRRTHMPGIRGMADNRISSVYYFRFAHASRTNAVRCVDSVLASRTPRTA